MAPARTSPWPPCAHTESREGSVLGQAEGHVLWRTGAQNSMGRPQGPPRLPRPSLGGRACPAPEGPTEPNPAAPVTPSPLSRGTRHADRQSGGQPGKAPPRPALHTQHGASCTGPVRAEKGQGCLPPRAHAESAAHRVLSDSAAWPLGPRRGARALRACSPLSLKAGCTHFDPARGCGGLGVSHKISGGGQTAAGPAGNVRPPHPRSLAPAWAPLWPSGWAGPLVPWVTPRSSLRVVLSLLYE